MQTPTCNSDSPDQTLHLHLAQFGYRVQDLLVAFAPDLAFLSLCEPIFCSFLGECEGGVARIARAHLRTYKLDVMQVNGVKVLAGEA